MLLNTALITASGLTVFGIFALLGVLQLGGIIDPISMGSIDIQIMVALAIISTVWFQFAITLMRIEGEVTNYGIVHILQRVVLIGGFVVLHLVMADTFRAFVLAYTGSLLLSGIHGIYYSRSHLQIVKPSKDMLRVAARFSVPMMVHSVALWTITSSGRWIGTLYMTLEELAPYTLVTFFFGLVSMFPRVLFQARVPDIGTAFAKHEYEEGIRIINLTVLVSIVIVVSIYAGVFILLFVLGVKLPDSYMPPPLLLLLASVANVLDAIYLRGIQALVATKRTVTQAAVTIVSGLITVGVSFLLVSTYDDMGLVAAFVVGLLVQTLSSNIAAQQSL